MSNKYQNVINVALAAGKEFQTIEAMAREVSFSVGYAGGYLYSGERWTLEGCELAHSRHFVKEYDRRDPEEFMVQNLALLGAADVGEVLRYCSSLASGRRQADYLKTEQGFILTESLYWLNNEMEDNQIWSAWVEAQTIEEAKAKQAREASREGQRRQAFSLGERVQIRGL